MSMFRSWNSWSSQKSASYLLIYPISLNIWEPNYEYHVWESEGTSNECKMSSSCMFCFYGNQDKLGVCMVMRQITSDPEQVTWCHVWHYQSSPEPYCWMKMQNWEVTETMKEEYSYIFLMFGLFFKTMIQPITGMSTVVTMVTTDQPGNINPRRGMDELLKAAPRGDG